MNDRTLGDSRAHEHSPGDTKPQWRPHAGGHSPARPRRRRPRTLKRRLGREAWRGLVVAPEHRCSPYDKKRDYPYPQSVERDIVRELGTVHGPYTGTCFASTTETDIEHMVAASEAHDSGLCAADQATKRRFAQDLRNLTLASPHVNRHHKSGTDAGEWLPDRNQCWFAGRVLQVKLAYGLTVDQTEATAFERARTRTWRTSSRAVGHVRLGLVDSTETPNTGLRERFPSIGYRSPQCR